MKIIFTILTLTMVVFATDLNEQIVKISSTDYKKNEATIPVGNLVIGQSGIVVNDEIKDSKFIICYATIVSSQPNESIIKFDFREIIEQNAMPKTKLLPKDGDTFVLNHLYKNSMIIAPNFESLNETKKLYNDFNFLDSDLFAAYLKINNTPVPKKKDILNFAHQNDLGTVFIIENDKINIVDALSFSVIKTIPLKINDKNSASPFHTNIEDIKTSTLSFFEEKDIGEYHSYYKKLLGSTDGK